VGRPGDVALSAYVGNGTDIKISNSSSSRYRLPNSLGGLEDSRYLPSSAPRRYTNSTTLGAALRHASYGGRHVCVERFTG
jgi:hypothetical protein